MIGVAAALLVLVIFVAIPAKALANFLKVLAPMTLVGGGVLLILAKQAALGTVILFAGLALWRRMRENGVFKSSGKSGHSIIRSAAFEVELNEDQSVVNGVVLAGTFEGRVLETLPLNDLKTIRNECAEDDESLVLLDSYLDRRFSTWRENA